MSTEFLPTLTTISHYALLGIPTLLAGGLAFGAHEFAEAYSTYRRAKNNSSEMRQPLENTYLIHIGGTGDVGLHPDDSFSFACLKHLILEPMKFPKENICALSQTSESINHPKKPFHLLSTEEYFNVAKDKSLIFIEQIQKNKIQLIITGLSQGGAIAARLAQVLLKDTSKIDHLLLMPIHATLTGTTANFWPKWMRDYLIRFFYPFRVLEEFHHGSAFLENNKQAMEELNKIPTVIIEPIHDGLDPFVSPTHGHATETASMRWDQILSITLPMIATSLIFNLPFAIPLFIMMILMGLWNHILGVNNPKIVEHIYDFINDKKKS